MLQEESPKVRIDPIPIALSAITGALMIAVLWWLGRVWWCKLSDRAIYVNEAWNSSHTSQHLFDPYTFTHVLHGVLFFWLTGILFAKLVIEWRFLIAIIVEAAWEVLENTNFIIEKYRENTASLDYFGDSISNSIGDLIACALGFWVAVKFGWWRSLVFFFLTELVLLWWIRDSLLLNIVMLIYPLDGIKQWQMAPLP
ncbi:DUF2585 family protein [Leptolyngbya sp. 7M]|uniref:DUF2585 family protein n=1 Tax=Leptolyngbya sp. 7M TaxID=2812896 RepID=UPI001B8CD788|nr:DUF2585 family protein [Leptolyngbya sp. 7M]QYO66086.1 DUF2585 family protein [Leptolyngbya sp. 7M]